MIYWTYKSIPELSRLSVNERRELVRKTFWKAWLHWQTWAAFALGMLLPFSNVLILRVLAPMVPPSVIFGPHHSTIFVVIGVLPALSFAAVGYLIFDQTFTRMLRRHLADLVPTRCRVCGYDLRASPERCPECGTAVAGKARRASDG